MKNRFLSTVLLMAWAALTIIVGQYIVAFPMVWLLGDQVSQPVWTTIYTALAYTVAFALCVLLPHFCFKKFRTNREELGLTELPTWTDLGLAPLAFIAYLLIAALLASIFEVFPWFDANQAQDVGFSNLYLPLDRIVAFIALVVIAPIAEEIIFRGWLYGKLRARLSLFPAMLLVSILFGVIHGQWNVGVNVFAMSLVLCLQREVTGTIYSGIILHMLKNGVAFYLLYILGIG